MVDFANVWDLSTGKSLAGGHTFLGIPAGAQVSLDIAHELGTDDVDVILSLLGSSGFGVGISLVTALAIGSDKRHFWFGDGTMPVPISQAPSGSVRIYVQNNHSSTQDIVMTYRIISRVI